MGVIARLQGARGIDAGSIAGLLSSQKDNIAAALPSGLGNLLGGTGLLDSRWCGADGDCYGWRSGTNCDVRGPRRRQYWPARRGRGSFCFA